MRQTETRFGLQDGKQIVRLDVGFVLGLLGRRKLAFVRLFGQLAKTQGQGIVALQFRRVAESAPPSKAKRWAQCRDERPDGSLE